jgi:hypothetical protein
VRAKGKTLHRAHTYTHTYTYTYTYTHTHTHTRARTHKHKQHREQTQKDTLERASSKSTTLRATSFKGLGFRV